MAAGVPLAAGDVEPPATSSDEHYRVATAPTTGSATGLEPEPEPEEADASAFLEEQAEEQAQMSVEVRPPLCSLCSLSELPVFA